jgi:hypothetical protein
MSPAKVTWKKVPKVKKKKKKRPVKDDPSLGPAAPLFQEPLEPRRCLGWCGTVFRTTRGVRLCKRCTMRAAVAATGYWQDAQACEIQV